MTKIVILQEEIKSLRGEQEATFKKYSDGKGNFDTSVVPAAEVTAIIDREKSLKAKEKELGEQLELDDAFKAHRQAVQQEGITNQFGGGAAQDIFGGRFTTNGKTNGEQKSLGDIFVDSKSYKQRRESNDLSANAFKVNPLSVDDAVASVKTLMSTAAGLAPFVPRSGVIIPSAQRKPVVADLIPITEADQAGTRYLEETTFTNNAAAVAEGGTKPEAALALTERFAGMTKVAVSLPVTEEQMADVPQIRDYINNRLTLMLRLEEDRELLQGSGAGAEMLGFLNKPGIQTLALGALDPFSAVLKMIVQIEETVGYADVSGMVAHPMDWFKIRTRQDSTGRFIYGDPDKVEMDTLWGKPLVRTTGEPQGSLLIGDFQTYSQILRKLGITFRVGYVNAQFIQNIMTILAEFRELLVIYRASAFGTVTGAF